MLLGGAGQAFPPPQDFSLGPGLLPHTPLSLNNKPYTPPEHINPDEEEIIVHGNRAPIQRDPYARYSHDDSPQQSDAATMWQQHVGQPPSGDPYQTDVGGQPGRP